MGADKATLVLDASGSTLAERIGTLLQQAVAPAPAIEVGPGASGLPTAAAFGEADPHEGPLTAVLSGRRALARAGFAGPVLVLATDLPWLTPGALGWLVGVAGECSVVPVVDGRPQPLAARWSVEDLDRAEVLAAAGERAVSAVFGASARFVSDAEWGAVAEADAFRDADEPVDLRRR